MADNRLGLRCTICHKVVNIARLKDGAADWAPSENSGDLGAFLLEHANWCGGGILHVDLQSENDRKVAVALHNPSSEQ
jgi:hypothetical protein